MLRNSFFNAGRILGGLLVLLVAVGDALAQPLEDVSLEFQDSGVVATIRLTGPVRYLSHFPASHGDQLEIFYERIKGPASDEKWIDNEVRKSPPSGLIPSFTVVTRGQQTDKPKLVINFSREAEYSVSMGKDKQSFLITIQPVKRQAATGTLPALPTVAPLAAPVGTPTAEQARMAETNKQAFDLMTKGRDALAAKNNDAAMDAFNKLLLLPPNDYTQDGQEWVGVARERAGQPDKAKTEYDLYLRLYPEGEGAARVAQRQNNLSRKGIDDKPDNIIVEERKKSNARWLSFGSISSRYYSGNSTIDSTYVFNSATTTSTQSLMDQSMLISTVNASERYLSEDYDGRLVFGDVSMVNFQNNHASQNRLNAFYGEIKGRTSDYLVRLGRQSPMGAGVQSRFDGVAGGYGDAQSLRVNAVAGKVVDYSQGSKPSFNGASVDSGPVSVYALNQSVDGVVDRRALGAEFRQFKDRQTVYALVDYDTYFKAVNTAQVMGSTSMPGYNLNYMVDHRRPITVRSALNGATTSSVSVLEQSMSAVSLRKLALARTSVTNMGQVGVSMPLRKNWQVSTNLRLSNTTALAASDPTLPAVAGSTAYQPGRGLEKGVNAQLIGSSLYREGDTWSASAGLSYGQAKGNSLYLYNHTAFSSSLMVDTSLQFSSYTDQFAGKSKRTSPMLRGSYRLRESLYIDADGGMEFINYSGPTQSSKTTRYSYSLGFRWDF
jgi:tetratricopeptide (TPR) repeat protein